MKKAIANLIKRFNIIDWMNYIYFTIVTVFIIVRHDRVPHGEMLIAAHILYLGVMTLLVHVTHKDSPKWLLFLRHFYQLIFMTAIYRETEMFMRFWHNGWLDAIVVKFEAGIFGGDPSLLIQPYIRPWLTEFFKFTYSTYFVLVPLIPLALYFTNRKQDFYHYLFMMALALYSCYFLFPFFPVEGPRYYFNPAVEGRYLFFPQLINPDLTFYKNIRLDGYYIAKFLDRIMSGVDATGACIPSAHNAAVAVFFYSIYKFYRKLFPFAVPLLVCISIATVYNRYHYTTDMVLGLTVGAIIAFIVDRVFKKEREFIIEGSTT